MLTGSWTMLLVHARRLTVVIAGILVGILVVRLAIAMAMARHGRSPGPSAAPAVTATRATPAQ